MITKNKEVLSEISEAIKAANRIALFCHVRPDGDTIGSALGLGWALEAIGKQVQYVCPGFTLTQGVFTPEMVGRQTVFLKEPEAFDCSILLDISSLDRTNAIFSQPGARKPDICIDHHISNPGIARINLIKPDAPATAMIIAIILPELNLTISEDVAEALLSGIIMDTQGFATSNTTPASLRVAADLMEKGADLYRGIHEILIGHTFEAAKLWSYGLSRLERDGNILWSYLTLEDRARSQYTAHDDGGQLDYMASTVGTSVSILFVEQEGSRVKISWRSRPGINVATVAESFGGGGHMQAAGAEVNGALEEVIGKVLAATREVVNKS